MTIAEVGIGDGMKRRVVTVTAPTAVQAAARVVMEQHLGALPVVDEEGVLTRVARLDHLLGVFPTEDAERCLPRSGSWFSGSRICRRFGV